MAIGLETYSDTLPLSPVYQAEHDAAYFSVRGQPFMAPPYQLVSSSVNPFPAGQRIRSRLEAAEAYADQISATRFRRSMIYAALPGAKAAATPARSSSTGRTALRASDYSRSRSGGLVLQSYGDGVFADISRSVAHAELWYAFRPWAARALLRRRLLIANPMLGRTMIARWREAADYLLSQRDAADVSLAFWALRGRLRRLRAALAEWRCVAAGWAEAMRARQAELGCALAQWRRGAHRRKALSVADGLCLLARMQHAFSRWVWGRLWRQLYSFGVSRRAMVVGAHLADGVARVLVASPRLAGAWRTWTASVADAQKTLARAAVFDGHQRVPRSLAKWRAAVSERRRWYELALAAARRLRYASCGAALRRWRGEADVAMALELDSSCRARRGALSFGLSRWRVTSATDGHALALLRRALGHASRRRESRVWSAWMDLLREGALVLAGAKKLRGRGLRRGLAQWAGWLERRACLLARSRRAFGHWAQRDMSRALLSWVEAHGQALHVGRLLLCASAAALHAGLARCLRTWIGDTATARPALPKLSGAALVRARALSELIGRWRAYNRSHRTLSMEALLPAKQCSFLWHTAPLSHRQMAAVREAAALWLAHVSWRRRGVRALSNMRHLHLRRASNAMVARCAENRAWREAVTAALSTARHAAEARAWRSWADAGAKRSRKMALAASAVSRAKAQGASRAWQSWRCCAAERAATLGCGRAAATRLLHRGLARSWATWRCGASLRRSARGLARRVLGRESSRCETSLDSFIDAPTPSPRL